MATDASSEAARMPDGSTYNLMSTKYPLRVCVQDYQHELYFAVCPLSTYDVILGKKWHEDYNVRNKYQTNSITFRENGRTRRINATLELPQNLWRKKQVVHHMQKENAVFAVLLRSREPQEPFELNAVRVNQDATDQDIQEILLEYADYFLKTFQKDFLPIAADHCSRLNSPMQPSHTRKVSTDCRSQRAKNYYDKFEI